ncbi:MAG: NfeD family protein [Rhodothermales bacterium]|nr:NfeD family protein [Rhodothermales bacterium]
MDTVYLVSMIVGGFFVLLSIFGGEMEHHVDVSSDVHGDFGGATAHDSDTGGGGFVDLLSLRTLFFFLAFFGLTGSLLSWTGSSETLTAITATVVGLVVGLGGNFAIQRIGHARVSSEITSNDLTGLTGRVLIPFSGSDRGKIRVVVKGNELRLPARSLDVESAESFETGDEVVVVSRDGVTVEVVKPT